MKLRLGIARRHFLYISRSAIWRRLQAGYAPEPPCSRRAWCICWSLTAERLSVPRPYSRRARSSPLISVNRHAIDPRSASKAKATRAARSTDTVMEISRGLGSRLNADRGQSSEPMHKPPPPAKNRARRMPQGLQSFQRLVSHSLSLNIFHPSP